MLATQASAGPRHVIVAVWDTVRADRASLYGYGRDTTPNLAALARKGVVFEDAQAQSDWTVPGFASIFTGRGPDRTEGFRDAARLSSAATLARRFRERGFRTAAFVGGIFGVYPQLGEGFDVLKVSEEPNSFAQAVSAASPWLEKNAASPFFLVLHGLDAHYPYTCPARFRDRFDPEPGTPLPDVDERFAAAFSLDRPRPAWPGLGPTRIPPALLAVKARPRTLARLAAQYDGCLSYEDDALRPLFSQMDRLGLWKDTILIVTADHGEALGERGRWGHAALPLYEEITRVPLVVYLPGRPDLAGRRVSAPVAQIDLLPSLLDLEGWPLPEDGDGRSFRALLGPGGNAPPRGLYGAASTFERDELDLQSFREGRWKLLRDRSRWMLFDLKEDPRESRDLLPKEPETAMKLLGELIERQAARGPRGRWPLLDPSSSPSEPRGARRHPPEAPPPWVDRVLVPNSDTLTAFKELAKDYDQLGAPALEPLCRKALSYFPRETLFYDALEDHYWRHRDFEKFLDVTRAKVSGGASKDPVADAMDEAEGLFAVGRAAQARAALREALARSRFSSSERAEISSGLETIAASLGAKPAARTDACRFEDGSASGRWSAACGAGQVSFDDKTGRLTYGKATGDSATLAERLAAFIETRRFAADPSAESSALEKLRKAGYLGPE